MQHVWKKEMTYGKYLHRIGSNDPSVGIKGYKYASDFICTTGLLFAIFQHTVSTNLDGFFFESSLKVKH